jgi:3-hydroxyisobutyrate dehydrogenase-like beta-hydroxyacid dehydrogenase
MSTNLVAAGHDVTVYNRTASKCDAVAGAAKAGSPAEATKGAEFIFTMIADDAALKSVILGEKGIVSALTGGQIIIDMSTVSIKASKECNDAIADKKCKFLRAPVSGSTVVAKAAGLTVLCSGPKDAYDKTLPLFEKISKLQFYLGDGDGARAMKIGLNMMIATSLQMLAESATLCKKAGIDWNAMLDVIDGSVLASPLLKYKIPPLRERKFDPAFSANLMAKDLELALDMGRQLGVCTPSTALTKQMLEANIARGNGDKDFAYLVRLIEELSGV